MNVEAYGGVTGLPWRMCSESIANELWHKGLLDSQEAYQAILDGTLGVHPTFFYESAWNLLGLTGIYLLGRYARKFDGELFLSYFLWYGLGRFWIEGLRTDSLYFFGTGIRSSQMLGIVSALTAVALYVFRRKTAGPATPPFVKGGATEAAVETAQAMEAGTTAEAAPAAEPAEEEEEKKGERQDGGDAD